MKSLPRNIKKVKDRMARAGRGFILNQHSCRSRAQVEDSLCVCGQKISLIRLLHSDHNRAARLLYLCFSPTKPGDHLPDATLQQRATQRLARDPRKSYQSPGPLHSVRKQLVR